MDDRTELYAVAHRHGYADGCRDTASTLVPVIAVLLVIIAGLVWWLTGVIGG